VGARGLVKGEASPHPRFPEGPKVMFTITMKEEEEEMDGKDEEEDEEGEEEEDDG
jgi:hypothetical protein